MRILQPILTNTYQKMSKDIIKDSQTIREALKKRLFEELDLGYKDIVLEAKNFGIKNVAIDTISRYLNNKHRGSLTQEAIMFLCYRWGIFISLNVGMPKIINGKIEKNIPPYNEEQCLKVVRELWKKTPPIKKKKGK